MKKGGQRRKTEGRERDKEKERSPCELVGERIPQKRHRENNGEE